MEVGAGTPQEAYGGRRQVKRLALLSALYAFVVSAIFALTNPPFEAPDEPAHLRYVNFVLEHQALPNQLVPARASQGEGHQHPLYYAGAAVVVGAVNGGRSIPVVEHEAGIRSTVSFEDSRSRTAFFALRLLGALLVGLFVFQIPRLAVLLGVEPLWPTLFVATLPQFLFIGSSVSNDGLTALLCALAVSITVEGSLEGTGKGWLKAGLWTGLAFLAKKSSIVLFPCGLLLLGLTRKTQPNTVRNALWYVGFTLLLAGPVLVRNQVLYGDPLGNHMELVSLQGLVTPRSIADPYFLKSFPTMLVSSFVGLFGWTAVQVPMRLVAVYSLLLAPGLIWCVRFIARHDASPHPVGMRSRAIYLVGVVALNLVGLIHYNLSFTQAQGRLLFPSLAALATLWGLGMTSLTRDVAAHKHKLIVGVAAAGLIAFDCYCLMLNYRFYR